MSALRKMEETQIEKPQEGYFEPENIRLSERDAIAFVNSIKFPPKANDFLRQAMHRHIKKS